MSDEQDTQTGAIVHMDLEGAPTFEPTRKVESWDTPEGKATGLKYDGPEIMEREDHVAMVEAVMAKDAAANQ